MRFLMLVALASLLLAGCGAPAEPATEEDEAFDEFEAEATATTGVIRGVVVDPSITPIPDVTVTVLTTEMEITTNANGAFVFSDVEPGTYSLKASKIGYHDIQSSVTVVAGIDKPDIVRIQLLENLDAIPFYEEITTKGFHTCATSAFTLCNFLDGILCIAGQCDILQDNTIMNIPISQQPTHINSEEVWKPTQLLGQNFDFYLERIDEGGSWNHIRSVAGASPLLLVVDEDEIIAQGYGTTHDLRHRTFPQLEDPTSAVFIDQEFTVYTHVFYNYAPPEGWRFTDSDGVPEPPQ